MPIVTVNSQHFYNSNAPLESSAQVDTPADLTITTKVIPFVGKMVHVKSNNTIYVCDSVSSNPISSTWSKVYSGPLGANKETRFYLTAADGSKFAVLAVKEGSEYRLGFESAT